MKRFRQMRKSTLPLFLAFWLLMMLILGWLNLQAQTVRIKQTVESARRDVERSYEEIWAGGAEEEHKPVILTWRLSQSLWEYHGVALFRVYDSDGKELARSQMSKGVACPYGTATYSWTILPDPVLTEEEQVALAQRLSKERSLSWFYGTAGGLFEDQAGEGLYCEVTGVADEQRQVIYPQKLTYVYQDHTVTLIDSTSDFFADKELTTLRFDAVQLASALEGIKASPRELLRCYRQAEENLEKLLPSGTPSMSSVSVSSSGSTCAPMGEDAILASAYAYAPLPTALMGMGPTAVLTLLAAIVLAVFTDRRQRQALQRERAFTRAAAHELKTPLAVLRTHAEALREDIDPARRQEYLGVVVEESDRMAALVGSLMDLARLESGVKTEGEPLDLTASYNLAGYNYTLRDLGDGFAMFDGAVNVLDYVMEDYMVLANYVQSFENGVVTGYAEPAGRITITDGCHNRRDQVPVVGSVAAGSPILAEECIEDYLTFDTGGRVGEHFALRVRGESMLEAGILPGDLVVVHQQQEVKSGDIVVALFDDEATVKTFRRENGHVWLYPENSSGEYQPIDGEGCSILGRVVAVIRRY